MGALGLRISALAALVLSLSLPAFAGVVDDQIAAAGKAIASKDFKAASKALDAAEAAAPGADAVVPGATVARIWFYRGVVEHLQGDKKGRAIEYWRQSLVLDDSFVWDARVLREDDPETLYEALRSEVRSRVKVDIKVPEKTGAAKIFVDGTRRETGDKVREGNHLAQITCPDGKTYGQWSDFSKPVRWFLLCPGGVDTSVVVADKPAGDDWDEFGPAFGAPPGDGSAILNVPFSEEPVAAPPDAAPPVAAPAAAATADRDGPVAAPPEAAPPAPVVAAPEPVVAAPEPVVAAPEPVVAAPEPVVAAPEPVVAAPEPVVAAPEPVVAAPEPVVAAPEPVVAAPEPVVAAPEPVVAAPEPVVAAPEPVVAEVSPALPDPEPPDTLMGVPPAPSGGDTGQGPGAGVFLLAGGGALLAGGVAINFAVVNPTWSDIEAARAEPLDSRAQADALTGRFDTFRGLTLGLLGGGVVLTGVGVLLEAPVTPVFGPGQIGVTGRF